MQVKLWGVRGSIPAPMDLENYTSRIHQILDASRAIWKESPDASNQDIIDSIPPYLSKIVGGESTCLELIDGEDQLIFDMGTGARRLGFEMMSRKSDREIHILMTHTHWDHIQGWPFFIPAYIPENRIQIHSGLKNCRSRFNRQQNFDFFPVTLNQMASRKKFHVFQAGDEFPINDFVVKTAPLRHPGDAVAYRVEKGGSSFILATDTEFYGNDLKGQIKEKSKFFHGADLLVMDAQYTLDEASQRIGWGHTAMVIAVDCAVEWGIRRIVFTHHEPSHNDKKTYELLEIAKEHLARKNLQSKNPEILLGSQDDIYDI